MRGQGAKRSSSVRLLPPAPAITIFVLPDLLYDARKFPGRTHDINVAIFFGGAKTLREQRGGEKPN